tara:strand:- start:295 stop:957 length:663 start_codon:yes stop_codon:yes gene_type:complete
VSEFCNYIFSDPALLQLALTHRSASHKNNERLEFLGDAILGQVIADYLYNQFPDADEGQLTRSRAVLVNRETLATIARSIELSERIELGVGESKNGGAQRDSILANTLEALIGAIYLDGGLDACAKQLMDWFAPSLKNIDPKRSQKDAKTQLQEYLQGRGHSLPTYTATAITGPAHDQCFTIECQVEILPSPVSAKGRTRRMAEQQAATLMIKRLVKAAE